MDKKRSKARCRKRWRWRRAWRCWRRTATTILRPRSGPRGFNIEFDGEEHGNKRWRARFENGHGSRQLLAACVEAGAPLSLFEPARASLHEAFVALVGDKAMPAAE
jgi:hypothetical protein